MSLNPHGWTALEYLPIMDPSLVQFQRQYMQQVQNLNYPPRQYLLDPNVQNQIYKHFFDGPLRGPPMYQRRVLKQIISLIESAIKDPDEDAVSDSLMEHMGYLSTFPTPPPAEAASETQVITYILPEPFDTPAVSTPRILIEEAPNLLAAGSNVGLRTWEASLHLATYLHSNPDLVRGKNIIELGAGTGLASLLCAGPLEARQVLATDGLPHVVEAMEKNILRNRQGLFSGENGAGKSMPVAKVLDWGDLQGLDDALDVNGEIAEYGLILGADITYSPDVVPVLAELLRVLMVEMFPSNNMAALIATTVRNVQTLKVFREACAERRLTVEELQFTCPSVREQRGFFHEQAFPIVILRIHA